MLKQPCTTIFSGPTGSGKTHLALELLRTEYLHYFENIIILCPTLRWNRSYLEQTWIWREDRVFCIEPEGKLFEWIEKLSRVLENQETLFIVDDMIADESLDKRRQSLLDLAISGRHRKHSLWLLTQSYTAIPKNLRRQKKQLFLWYPHEKSDLKLVDDECNLDLNITKIKKQLKASKYACLYIRLEFPYEWRIIA